MSRIKKVESMVSSVLLSDPKTRGSDDILTAMIYKKYYGIGDEPFEYVMWMRSSLGLPSTETIGRCRRKLQEQSPLIYGSSEQTRSKRKSAEDEFKEYARR